MYITSECYGITPLVGIKCPPFSNIAIHDVMLGVKGEPTCRDESFMSSDQHLNPICCRPSCNDCFQRADVVINAIKEDCNGLNSCHVKPEWKLTGACDVNGTEYMTVAYNCHIPTKVKVNNTSGFSIDENLCGRKSKVAIVLPMTERNATEMSSEATNHSKSTAHSLQPTTFATNIPVVVSTTSPKEATQTSSTSSQRVPTTESSSKVLVKVTSSLSPPSTTLTDTTVFQHKAPTKRFVSTSRVRFSSTSTTFTRLGMANNPDTGKIASKDNVNRGAMIGGVAAAAGLLLFALSLAMIRRRRKNLVRRPPRNMPISLDVPNGRPRPLSPVEDVITPTSISEEGQCPWTFGPPDFNYATVHSEERPVSVRVQNLPPNIVERPSIRPPSNYRQNICASISGIAMVNNFDDLSTRASSSTSNVESSLYSQRKQKEIRKHKLWLLGQGRANSPTALYSSVTSPSSR